MTDYYLDQSAGSMGTGTFASPFNSVTADPGVVLTASDTVWIRRNSKTYNTSGQSWHQNYMLAKMVGWPTSTQSFYSTRPSTARAGWDGDAPANPIVNCTAYLQLFQGYSLGGLWTLRWDIYNIRITVTLTGVFSASCILGGHSTNATNPFELVNYFKLTNCIIDWTNDSSNGAAFGSLIRFDQTYTGQITSISCKFSGVTINLSTNGTSPGTDRNGTSAVIFGGNGINAPGAVFKYDSYWNNVTVNFTSGWLVSAVYFNNKYTTDDYYASSKIPFYKNTVINVSTTSALAYDFILPKSYSPMAPMVVWDGLTINFNDGVNNTGGAIVAVVTPTADDNKTVVKNLVINYANKAYFNGNVVANVLSCIMRTPLQAITCDLGANLTVNNCASILTFTVGTLCKAVAKVYNGTTFAFTSALSATLYLLGKDSDMGSWQKFGSEGSAIVTNTVRSGGESFSVKVLPNNNLAGKTKGVALSEIGSDTMFVPLAAGTTVVTIYGMYITPVTANTPNNSNVWLEYDYINGSNVTTTVTSRTAEDVAAALTSDASTWSNVPGGASYTQFKLVATIVSTIAQNIPIRIGSSHVDATGIVYIDPKPVLT